MASEIEGEYMTKDYVILDDLVSSHAPTSKQLKRFKRWWKKHHKEVLNEGAVAPVTSWKEESIWK